MNKMQFGDYVWRHNPEKLKMVYSKRVKVFRPPNQSPVVQSLGTELRVVTGRGDFFGENAFSDFFRLAAEFSKQDTALLTLPGFDSFYARFKRLELDGEAGEGLVGYSFEFWEVPRSVEQTVDHTWHRVQNGESLWDVSAQNGVSVERLLGLNPGVRNPFDLKAGQEVRLR